MAFALLRLLNDGRHVGTDAEKEAVRKAVSEKMSNVMREKWANEEYRETRIAQYKQGWQNSENKANINKGRSYSVRTPSVVNLDTNEIYDSVFRAEKATGICHIGDVVTGNRPIAGGYHWAYLDETLRVPYQDRLRKKAVVIDGVLFQRQKDAAEFLGITRAHLLAIIDGKKPSIHEIRRPTIEDQGKLTQKGE
jgi:hypothetical protein